mmetsp:Transcript_98916/g.277025  ORF Transcript_98916/g.277025 Transcript_98916/m.277025 type:complete len:209 (-) Transcript_98916:580-1206(-)
MPSGSRTRAGVASRWRLCGRRTAARSWLLPGRPASSVAARLPSRGLPLATPPRQSTWSWSSQRIRARCNPHRCRCSCQRLGLFGLCRWAQAWRCQRAHIGTASQPCSVQSRAQNSSGVKPLVWSSLLYATGAYARRRNSLRWSLADICGTQHCTGMAALVWDTPSYMSRTPSLLCGRASRSWGRDWRSCHCHLLQQVAHWGRSTTLSA